MASKARCLLPRLWHHGRIGVVVGYDEGLSHIMQGGCDAIVIPSRFEPCADDAARPALWLRTSGYPHRRLAVVIDANGAAVSAGVATGFQFAQQWRRPLRHARLVDACQSAVWIASAPGMKPMCRGTERRKIRRTLSLALLSKGLPEQIRTVPQTLFRSEPGTSGLRKKVPVFNRSTMPRNFISRSSTRSTFKGKTLVIGGDSLLQPRGHQEAIAMAAASSGGRVMVRAGRHPVDARRLACHPQIKTFGSILSASRNPVAHGDFGIKYNAGNGGPAPEADRRDLRKNQDDASFRDH
jgi:hypothetical protein